MWFVLCCAALCALCLPPPRAVCLRCFRKLQQGPPLSHALFVFALGYVVCCALCGLWHVCSCLPASASFAWRTAQSLRIVACGSVCGKRSHIQNKACSMFYHTFTVFIICMLLFAVIIQLLVLCYKRWPTKPPMVGFNAHVVWQLGIKQSC